MVEDAIDETDIYTGPARVT